MRWFFLCLFVANCGLLLWHWQEESRIERIDEMNKLAAVDVVMPGERIRLFGEKGGVFDVPSRDVGGEIKKPGLCHLLGPIESKSARVSLSDYLNRANVEFALREIKVNQRVDFAVYLEPQINREKSVELMELLKKKGVDSFIISSGDLTNGLSLGVFADKNNALSQQKFVDSLGFDANIKEAEKFELQQWFVLDALNVEINDMFWKKMKKDFPDINKSQGFCQ